MFNQITTRTKVQELDVKTLIEAALLRTTGHNGHDIKVDVKADRVILTGKVHSFAEREDARFAAMNAPGVMAVENHLRIA